MPDNPTNTDDVGDPSHLPASDDDVQEHLKKIHQMRQDLESRMEGLYQKTGFSPGEIDNYFNNPSNFSVEKWEQIYRARKSLEDRVWSALGNNLKGMVSSQKESKDTKTRKGKTLGGRNRWIPVR